MTFLVDLMGRNGHKISTYTMFINRVPPGITNNHQRSVFSERSNLFSTDIYLKCQKMRFLVDRNGQKLSPDNVFVTRAPY